MEVMSTEGERALLTEDWELGEGVSSGAGGGGRTKWKVRDAICIWDLQDHNSCQQLPVNTFSRRWGRTFLPKEPVFRRQTRRRPPRRRCGQ